MNYRDFVHLHVHSHFSISFSSNTIKGLVERAADLGYPALALTDRGNLFGLFHFAKACSEKGIKPIIGCELDLVLNDGNKGVIVLLVKDDNGYKNLIALINSAIPEEDNFRRITYNITLDNLLKHSFGLVILTGGPRGILKSFYRQSRFDSACEFLEKLKKACFSKRKEESPTGDSINPDIYIEKICLDSRSAEYCVWLDSIAEKSGLRIIPANDVVVLSKANTRTLEILDKNLTPQEIKASKLRYFTSIDEMSSLFKHEEMALATEIAGTIKFDPSLLGKKYIMPRVDEYMGMNADQHLAFLCEKGLIDLYSSSDIARNRMDTELAFIEKRGFSSYFLVLASIVEYAQNQGIMVGPGRGSAAGSIVAYLTGITRVDPLKHNLLFERFLNPGRKGLPDIDIDVSSRRREEVIDFIARKFNMKRVAHVVAFDCYQTRSAVRAAMDYLEFTGQESKRVIFCLNRSKKIFRDFKRIALAELSDIESNKIKALVSCSESLIGVVKNVSTHAAGVIITPDDMSLSFPLIQKDLRYNSEPELSVLQFDRDSAEQAGLVKMDILSLKTLDFLDDIIKTINKRNSIDMSMDRIPLNEPEAFSIISSEHRTGIFQLDSSWMNSYIKQFSPSDFNELIILLALIRPGPMKGGLFDAFIKARAAKLARHDKSATSVKKDKSVSMAGDSRVNLGITGNALKIIEPILEETHGVVVFQEQVMAIASQAGGLTLSESDSLRRAMSKKKRSHMEYYRKIFVKGAHKNGISSQKAEGIYNQLSNFSEYGFNKSHSAAYAYISYYCAYLKARYFPCYAITYLNMEAGNNDKTEMMVKECRGKGYKIFGPDINESAFEYTLVQGKKAFRAGFNSIKFLGYHHASLLIDQVKRVGGIRNQSQCLELLKAVSLTSKAAEAVIFSGAFDSVVAREKLFEILTISSNSSDGSQSFDLSGRSSQLSFFKQSENLPNSDKNLFNSDKNFVPQEKIVHPHKWAEFQKQAIGYVADSTELTGYDWFFNHTQLFFSPLKILSGKKLFLGYYVKDENILKGRFCKILLSHPIEIDFLEGYALYELEEAKEKLEHKVCRVIPVEAAINAYPWAILVNIKGFPEDSSINSLLKFAVPEEGEQGMPLYINVEQDKNSEQDKISEKDKNAEHGSLSFIFEICRININSKSFLNLKIFFNDIVILPKQSIVEGDYKAFSNCLEGV